VDKGRPEGKNVLWAIADTLDEPEKIDGAGTL
jgi:hypothetical protein